MAFKDKTSISIQPTLTGQQKELLDSLIGQITPQVGKGMEAYEGEIAPPPTALHEAAFGDPHRIQTDSAIRALLSGDPAFDVDPTARRELYEAERAEAMRRFEEETLPHLTRAWGGSGGRTGAMVGAMRKAATDLDTNLYRRNTELLVHDEDMRRGELSAARDRMGAGIGAQAGRGQQLIALGDAQRGIQGQQNAEGYNKWLMAQPYYNPWLGYLATALGTQAAVPVTKQQGGYGGALLGAI